MSEYTGIERRKTVEHVCTKEDTIDAVAKHVDGIKTDLVVVKTDIILLKNDLASIHDYNKQTNEILTNIQGKLASIDKRLFVDNGQRSIQSKLIEGEARMTKMETAIEDVKSVPHVFAKYTVGILTTLGILTGAVIWIAKHV